MVYVHNSISVCNSIDHQHSSTMANPRQTNHFHRNNNNKRLPSSSPNCVKTACDRSSTRSASAVVDVVILIAVVFACGFLIFPYLKLVSVKSIEFSAVVLQLVKVEVVRNPVVYGSIAVSVTCVVVAAWILVICTTRKCGNPNCKGLRKAAEFDIQLETEDCVKNSSPSLNDAGGGGGGGLKRGLFELPRDHHRELEAELKKMAPPNGRAVLIFRARCGCSVGRLEVPGPKKQRKVKK